MYYYIPCEFASRKTRLYARLDSFAERTIRFPFACPLGITNSKLHAHIDELLFSLLDYLSSRSFVEKVIYGHCFESMMQCGYISQRNILYALLKRYPIYRDIQQTIPCRFLIRVISTATGAFYFINPRRAFKSSSRLHTELPGICIYTQSFGFYTLMREAVYIRI